MGEGDINALRNLAWAIKKQMTLNYSLPIYLAAIAALTTQDHSI
jgi:hypothetical protein